MLSRSVVVSDGIAQLHEPHNGKKLESHAECKKYDRASRDFLPVVIYIKSSFLALLCSVS